MKDYLPLLLFGFLLWTACSTQPDPSPSKSAAMDHLTGGEWMRVRFEYNGTDIWPIYPDCAKDDITAYRSDGTAYHDQGNDICDSNSAMRTDWEWQFIENESKIEERINDSTNYIRIIRVLTDTHFEYVSYNGADSIVASFEKI